MPLPVTEREKKAWPMAQIQIIGSFKASHRGVNMKRYPSAAPGRKATRTASTRKMRKKRGIITLLVFSMLWAPRKRVRSVPTTTMTW